MSFTFIDQQALLSILLGDSNSGTDDAYPLAIRKKYINRGELHFAKDSKVLREKTSGTVTLSQIALPSDFLEILAIIVNNLVLTREREASIFDYERWYNYAGSVPMYYISEESGVKYVKFFGAPNGQTYNFYYVKRPVTELSADADVSLLPEEFREASAYYAAYELLQQVGKSQISDRMYTKYKNLVRDAQMYVEQLYLNKSYAYPDVNSIGGFTNDIQGQGYDF